MDALSTAAALVQNRHNPEDVVRIMNAAIDLEDDPKETVTEITVMLVGLLDAAGHQSFRVDIILDIFAAIPNALEAAGPDVHLVQRADMAVPAAREAVFTSMTEGTLREDRIWTARTMGSKAAVVLEGSGFSPRYLIIVGGTIQDAETTRQHLAVLDGR